MSYSREIEIERANVNLDTGEIEALPVFTGGEASDGHILNMEGAKARGDVPWFVQHEADPRTQIGTLSKPRLEGDALLYDGSILLEGQGASADIRRDLALKISRGHVRRLSGRWDANQKDVQRRTDLPEDHPAYVNGEKASGPEAWGLYFEKWTPMEGSLVGLGADPEAVMRWAEDEDSSESVRGFWREQADALARASEPTESAPEEAESVVEQLEPVEPETIEEPEGERFEDNEITDEEIPARRDEIQVAEQPSQEAREAAAAAALREAAEQAREVGIGDEEIALAAGVVAVPEEVPAEEDLGIDEPVTEDTEEHAREEDEPEPISPAKLLDSLLWSEAEGNPIAQGRLLRERAKREAKESVSRFASEIKRELDEKTATPESGSVTDGPPPSHDGRVQAEPPSAPQTLAEAKWRAAAGKPLAQAKLIREERRSEPTVLDKAIDILRGMKTDREVARSRFREELSRRLGKVPDHVRRDTGGESS